jgi:hypothetical protein
MQFVCIKEVNEIKLIVRRKGKLKIYLIIILLYTIVNCIEKQSIYKINNLSILTYFIKLNK